MTRTELLKSPEYWEEVFTDSFFQSLKNFLIDNKLKKKDLAEKMGVHRSHISQILNAETDHRLSKFIKLALAMDKVPYIYLKDVHELIAEDAAGESIHMDFKAMEKDHKQCKILKRKKFRLQSKVPRKQISNSVNNSRYSKESARNLTESWSKSGITFDNNTTSEFTSLSKAS